MLNDKLATMILTSHAQNISCSCLLKSVQIDKDVAVVVESELPCLWTIQCT